MKTKIWLDIVLVIILVACAPAATTPQIKTPILEATPIVTRTSTATITPAPTALQTEPVISFSQSGIFTNVLPTSNWKTYISKAFFVSLRYPEYWSFYNTGSAVYSGTDGFFQLTAVGLLSLSAKEDCELELQNNMGKEGNRYGSKPTMEILQVDYQQACLILPSSDQPKESRGLSIVIIEYPNSVREHALLDLWADKNHIRAFISSLKFTY